MIGINCCTNWAPKAHGMCTPCGVESLQCLGSHDVEHIRFARYSRLDSSLRNPSRACDGQAHLLIRTLYWWPTSRSTNSSGIDSKKRKKEKRSALWDMCSIGRQSPCWQIFIEQSSSRKLHSNLTIPGTEPMASIWTGSISRVEGPTAIRCDKKARR